MPTTITSYRSHLVAMAGLLLVTLPVEAQTAGYNRPRSGPGVERSIDESDTVSPESLKKAAEELKLLEGAKFDTDLLNAILKLQANNPKLSNRELAEKFLSENKDLQDPKRKDELTKWMQQFGPLAGGASQPGGPSFVPNAEQQPFPRPTPPDPGLQLPRIRPGTTTRPHSQDGPTSIDRNIQQGNGQPDSKQGWPFDMAEGMKGRMPTSPPSRTTEVDPETFERRKRQFQAVAGWWEKNVGPLNETPAVRQLLMEFMTGKNATGEDTSSLGDLIDGPAGEGVGKIADRLSGSRFKLPDLGLGKGWGGRSSFNPPPPPSGSSFGGLGGINGETGSWLPVVILMALAAGGLVLWWLWPRLMAQGETTPRPLPGLGPWPVDPRSIADRDALIKAFEYLSVLVCGGGARNWNHVTIASALERAVPQASALADPLARLYAVARYTPATEPLPSGMIAEARGYLCDLAGVSSA